jgi:hypothetical protein
LTHNQQRRKENMANIFITYAKEDREQAEAVAKALGGLGWQVFWDRDIPPGKTWDEVIEKEIEAADCMLVLWSRSSVASEWVRAEAEEGLHREILIPVLIEETSIPLIFRPLQAASLVGWNEDPSHLSFRQLVQAIAETMGAPPSSEGQEATRPEVEEDTAKTLGTGPGTKLGAGRGLLGRIGELFRSMGRHTRGNGGGEGERRGQRAKPPSREEPAGGTAHFPVPPSSGVSPEPVLIGASAPRALKPGDEFTAHFVAYVKAVEEEVSEMLEDLSPRSEAVLGVQECRWQPGTPVTVRLSGRGLAIDPPEQAFVWEGNRNLLEFDVAVPADAADGTVVLKFDVLIDGIVVARLRLDVEISSRAAIGEPATVAAEPAHTAFASYSSADRNRVLDRVAAVRIAAGLDIFLDCLDLRPSEEWKPQLNAEIRKRDLFLLFWSAHAKESKWVAWEWQTALHDKGKEQMQIHPLEPDVKPPEELADIHFGDVYMWVRKGYEKVQP